MSRIYREAVKQWGADFQIGMVAEECGEVLSALSKFRRGRVRPLDLASEVADLRIMLEQVAHIAESLTAGTVTAEHFEEWVEEQRRIKLERLRGMLGLAREVTP